MDDDQTGAALGGYKNYLAGFGLSLGLTLLAYALVWRHVHTRHVAFSHRFLMLSIIVLALSQLLVQLIFFLHLGRESKPRWNLIVLIFAAGTVFILVAGSLWIMQNLKYHMPAQPSDQSIIHDEGIHVH
jgi:cytochrome o ubiquinol oxidase operon protein cyoD